MSRRLRPPRPVRVGLAARLLVALLLAVPLGVASAVAAPVGATTSPGATADAPEVVGTADVTGATSDAIDGTTKATNGTVDDTTNTTDETVENATDGTADDTTNTTDGTVDDTTNETGDAVENATDDTVDVVGNATNGTGDALYDATNGSVGVDVDVGGTATDAPGSGAEEGPPGETTDPGTGASGAEAAATETTEAALAPGGASEGASGGNWPGGLGGPVAGGAAAVAAGAVTAGLLARGTLAANAGEVGRSVAGTVRAAGLRETLREWARWLVGVAGYSRHDEGDPLAHDRRAEVYDAIRASPGTYPAQLDERVDGSFSTLRHHLDVLDREGLVASETIRGRRRYFPTSTDDPAYQAAINDEPSAAVLDALARHGPASVSEVAERLDRDPSTASHHLARLAADGLVVRERDGRAVTNRLAPEVAALLDRRRRDPAAGDDD